MSQKSRVSFSNFWKNHRGGQIDPHPQAVIALKTSCAEIYTMVLTGCKEKIEI